MSKLPPLPPPVILKIFQNEQEQTLDVIELVLAMFLLRSIKVNAFIQLMQLKYFQARNRFINNLSYILFSNRMLK